MKRIIIFLLIICFGIMAGFSFLSAGEVEHSAKGKSEESTEEAAFSLRPPRDFLEEIVYPEGRIDVKTDGRFEMVSPLTHDEVLEFYKVNLEKDLTEKAGKGRERKEAYKDIKYRNWADSTYIEDDGNLVWHSITISKEFDKGTKITIVKDNWSWIIGTLILRFIGVFLVLCVLYLFLSISGKVISKSLEKSEARQG